jgi:hypothetical protein
VNGPATTCLGILVGPFTPSLCRSGHCQYAEQPLSRGVGTMDFDKYSGLNESVELDVLEGKPGFVVAHTSGAHVRLSPSAFFILQAVRSGMTFDELEQVLNVSETADGSATRDRLRRAYDYILARLDEAGENSIARKLPWGRFGCGASYYRKTRWTP